MTDDELQYLASLAQILRTLATQVAQKLDEANALLRRGDEILTRAERLFTASRPT